VFHGARGDDRARCLVDDATFHGGSGYDSVLVADLSNTLTNVERVNQDLCP
jgi:hypothetical protein